jgi:adenylyltransferase/sulfurtransferase
MEGARYSRQIIFENIGEEGQQKLLDSAIAIIGLGALGTVSANNLTRAGVGRIKLIDRDYAELSNLQRQTLYDEDDVKAERPKAVAAHKHLSKVNSSILLEPVIADVNSSNIENLIRDCNLILDCTDNLESRLLLNEACDRLQIPWIYCGAVGSSCMTMNIIPGLTPCLLCFVGDSDNPENRQTCTSVGVLNMVTNIAASVQSAEAVKILLDSEEIRQTLFFMDVWNNSVEYQEIRRNPECPVCNKHRYRFLGRTAGSYATSICGRNEIQVVPSKMLNLDFECIAESLKKFGSVDYNAFMLKYSDSDGNIGIKLFKDGRAIIENAKDVNQAKAVYSEYIGL